jgi:chromosome segregation ATPase
MKDNYHLNSFETKASLRDSLQQLMKYNLSLSYDLATAGNELSQLRADKRRLQSQVTDNSLLLEELKGQVQVQANIVTSANLAKQEALKQYQAAYKRAERLQEQVYELNAALTAELTKPPQSLFDRVFGRA